MKKQENKEYALNMKAQREILKTLTPRIKPLVVLYRIFSVFGFIYILLAVQFAPWSISVKFAVIGVILLITALLLNFRENS
jgi:Flp pilus assembly protein TadB